MKRKLLILNNDVFRNDNRIKTTQPISMILVSFFSEDNVLSDEIKLCYIFEFQSNEYRAFRFFGDTWYCYLVHDSISGFDKILLFCDWNSIHYRLSIILILALVILVFEDILFAWIECSVIHVCVCVCVCVWVGGGGSGLSRVWKSQCDEKGNVLTYILFLLLLFSVINDCVHIFLRSTGQSW